MKPSRNGAPASQKAPPLVIPEIDLNRLERDWVEHSELFERAGTELADARADLEDARMALELVEAEVDKVVRADPEKFGITKVSEKSIANEVVLHPSVQKAKEAVNRAKHRVDIYAVRVSKMDHRKKALENCVDMLLAGFFAPPRARSESRKGLEEMKSRAAFGGPKRRRKEE